MAGLVAKLSYKIKPKKLGQTSDSESTSFKSRNREGSVNT